MAHRSRIDLAPPPVELPDGLAVPIDIERITARLRFDPLLGDTLDAVVEFTAGIADGFPVFDFRQTIRSAWLDGTPLPVRKITAEDLGGGADASMKVVRRPLAANSRHTLRLTSRLGPPQSRTNSNRPPRLLWENQTRLTFNFGFTDKRPGRYLETWLPANLIFDEFELLLKIEIVQTSQPHCVITTGETEASALNAWKIRFPATTACSPMLEIHSADRVQSQTGVFRRPHSDSAVRLELWKARGDSQVDLDRALDSLAENFPTFETRFGPYAHGERFVAFLDSQSQGMEYAGGATSDSIALRHELFHSWWGRGILPASQPDAWIDEALASLLIDSIPREVRLDTASKRAPLHTSNAWSRAANAAAGSQGAAVFAQLALAFEVFGLEAILRELYRRRLGEPITTSELEAFLLLQCARQTTVDLFHRFIHGLPDHVSPPRLDFVACVRSEFVAWDHPALVVRQSPDDLREHQSFRLGENWIYADVRNAGPETVAYAVVVVHLHADYILDPDGSSPGGRAIAALPQHDWKPNEERRLVIPCPMESVPTEPYALAAEILAQGNEPAGDAALFNALSWKNVVPRSIFPGQEIRFPVGVGNRRESLSQDLCLELRRPASRPEIEAALSYPFGLPLAADPRSPDGEPVVEATFPPGYESAIRLRLPPAAIFHFELILRLPDDLPIGEILIFDLVARRAGTDAEAGGIRFQLTAGE